MTVKLGGGNGPKNNLDYSENILVSRIHIHSASLNSDAGIYTCEAENSIGSSAPFEINVVVADAPEFTKIPAPIYRVNAGDQLEVQCEGFAEVPLRKLWTKNGVKMNLGIKYERNLRNHLNWQIIRPNLCSKM